MVRISVVIPTLNSEKYLKECIDSLLNQTFNDFEILIIDDGSTDNTIEILNSYNSSKIKIISGPKKGISAALNLGLDIAKGEYIARMDSDDICKVDRFKKQINFLDSNKDIAICGSFANCINEEKSYTWTKPVSDTDIKTMLLIDVSIIHPTVMMRKKQIDFYNLRYNIDYSASEDFDFWVRASEFVKFHNIPEELLCYRVHKANATSSRENAGRSIFLKIVQQNLIKKVGIVVPDNLIEAFWLANNDNIKFSYTELLNVSELFNELIKAVNSSDNYSQDLPTFQNLLITRINNLVRITSTNIVQQNYHNKQKNVLIVTPELTQTGAPLILFNLINILQKHDYSITLLAYCGGPLNKRFEDKNVPVIISPESFSNEELFKNITNNFGLIFVNTVLAYPAAKFLKEQSKTIWWIHEAEYVEQILIEKYPEIPEVLSNADNVFTVSNYAKTALSKFNKNISILKYGMDDIFRNEEIIRQDNNEKIYFSVLGAVEERKAHDVLIEAILDLPKEYSDKVKFNIIGSADKEYAIRLKEKTAEISNIAWYDFIPNVAQSDLFKDTDVLICISRDDPEPIVVSEAFMNQKVCLVSKNVGQKDMITDGVNGFIVETDNPIALKDKIIQIIDMKDELAIIGERSRQIYLENYTLEKFEQNLLGIINKTLDSSSKYFDEVSDSFLEKNKNIIEKLGLDYETKSKNKFNKICVAYLAYFNDAIDYDIQMVENFLNSYNENSAGVDHDLVIMAKNWTNDKEFAKLCDLAKVYDAKIIYLTDDGFDFGAYFRAANIIQSPYVFFIGSNNEIHAPNWLLYCYNALQSNSLIKLVGPMGSYEKGRSGKFPNPHIRTCSFMVERDLFVDYASKQKFPQTKEDTYQLEHCDASISKYVQNNGHLMAVVNSDGEVFLQDDWETSQTYISNDNAKALLTDKWARRYVTINVDLKPFIEITVWGQNKSVFPANLVKEYSSKVNIFVPNSTRFGVISSSVIHPLFIGSVNEGLNTEALQDISGDNISDKIDYYGELVGYYWVWKNILKNCEYEYIGFGQNCRLLDFNISSNSKNPFVPIYHDDFKPVSSLYTEESIFNSINGYDIILPEKNIYPVNIIDLYLSSHKKEDLDLAIIAILEKYPDYFESMKEVLSSNSMYLFGNFVIKKDLLSDFLSWLFDVLTNVENKINKTTYGDYSDIVASKFMSERLFNIWLVQNIKTRDLKVKSTTSYTIYYDYDEYQEALKNLDVNECVRG